MHCLPFFPSFESYEIAHLYKSNSHYYHAAQLQALDLELMFVVILLYAIFVVFCVALLARTNKGYIFITFIHTVVLHTLHFFLRNVQQ